MSQRTLRLHAATFLAMVVFATLSAYAMQPTTRLATKLAAFDLAVAVPKKFGEWHEDTSFVTAVVNPQALTLINRIYSQTLSRVYVNRAGYRVMLSIAYGGDQRDSMQAHHPEICYPAQGFEILSNERGTIATPFGDIPVRKIGSRLGTQRYEPVTYWITVGEKLVTTAAGKKLAELSYTLRGEIPDGLLFRISSIDTDTSAALLRHEQFARDLLAAVPRQQRDRLAGNMQP